jgi:hypothetical protein
MRELIEIPEPKWQPIIRPLDYNFSSNWTAEQGKEFAEIMGYRTGYLCLHNNIWIYETYCRDDRQVYSIENNRCIYPQY